MKHTWDVLSILDAEGRQLYVSPACGRIHGIPPEELTGRLCFDRIHPDDHPRLREILRALLDDPTQPQSAQFRFLHKDGGWVWVETIASNQLDDPAIRGIVAHSRDVSAWREVLEEMQESGRRYRELTDMLPETIFECDLRGRLTYVNQDAYRAFGYAREDMEAGLNVMDMLDPMDRARGGAHIAEVLRGGSSGHEYLARRKDGSTFPVIIHSKPILQEGRPVGLRGLIVDITERKRGDQERQELTERLYQAEKMEAVGQLAGGVAHDFNNQLSAILGFAEVMGFQAPEGPLRRNAEQIVRACRQATELTRQLLAFARKGKNERAPMDLHEVILDVAGLLGHTIDRRIEVCMELEAASPVLLGDATQIQNALINLALNARDAMPTGAGTLTFRTASVRLEAAECAQAPWGVEPGDFLRITVEDTGLGMDEEVRRRLFEPFFTTKAAGKGTGLGLASVRGMVKAHKGLVEVESRPGEGSRFNLYLPQSLDAWDVNREAAAPQALPEAAAAAPGGGAGFRVLVVDDEPLIRDLAVEILQGQGYQVSVAAHGRAALDHLRRHPRGIDLVVLDMVMPGLGGLELLEALEAEEPGLRALVMSGRNLEGAALERQMDGRLAFLPKPFRARDLLGRVSELLAGPPPVGAAPLP